MRKLLRVAVGMALAMPLMMSGMSLAHAADATVTISDSGFNPPSISIPVNGTITWTNSGSKVHTASSKLGPVSFDTGGLGSCQSFPINFTVPGTYSYISATDCGNPGGNPAQGFDCGTTAIVVVTDANVAYNPNAFNVGPTPTPTPVFAGPPQNVTVHITKDGFTPSPVTVALGGSVTFINDDNSRTHNAITTLGGNPQPFDTGGLGPGLAASFGFALQGTYTYTSAVDCLSGNNTPDFGCGPYQIIVSGQPSALAPAPSSAPVSAAVTGTTTVGIDDTNGFTPGTLVIKAGQTITWANSGKQVHTVVSDPGYANAFDSGGLDPSKQFSRMFPVAGSYSYHSSTEVNYAIDGMGNQVPQYRFLGTIVVQ